MDTKFWTIVNKAKETASDFEDRAGQLKHLLTELTAEEVVLFDKKYQEKMLEAYRWDLWGAAYVINGGCSDDGFHYFCAFLISEGEDVYNNAIRNPESLADIEIEEDAEFEEFSYVALEVYREKTGQELPANDIQFPDDPVGEEWDEDDVEKLYPKLANKYE
ncbi:MAG: DUF4240 domain-containing protein [bacterium]|nr:DUF4240 domain-containing protein [bacterium]